MPAMATTAAPHFEQFELFGKTPLVKLVRHFPAERGQKQEGQHKNRTRQRHKRCRLSLAELEQDEKDQTIAQEIIVERRQKLRPEQGCEPT